MLKLKSGRILFFEGIVAMSMEGNILVLELATKEKVELMGVTIEEMLDRRNSYFAEQVVTGKITKDFGDSVFLKLKSKLETAIDTLQAATTAYNSSAELANKASEVLAGTSDRVDLAADKVFKQTTSISERAANRFKQSIEDTCNNKVHKTAEKFDTLVSNLERELDYLEEA